MEKFQNLEKNRPNKWLKKNPWKVKLQTPSSKRKRALRREKKGGDHSRLYLLWNSDQGANKDNRKCVSR